MNSTGNRNVRFEIVVYVLLGMGYIALNMLYKQKITVLIFILTTLLYIVLHNIFSRDLKLINKIPYIFIISILVSILYKAIFNLEELEKEKDKINLYLHVP